MIPAAFSDPENKAMEEWQISDICLPLFSRQDRKDLSR